MEGQLTEFNVSGNEWLRESYITKRLEIGIEDVLNLNRLQDRIKLLHQDRLVDRVNAELFPGDAPGKSVLDVQPEESRPYSLGVSFNNYRSPSVGENQGEFYASLFNVTGFGDSLDVRYSLTKGLVITALPLTLSRLPPMTHVCEFFMSAPMLTLLKNLLIS